MSRSEFFQRTAELAATGTPFVVVTLAETTGSTPADAGAKMIVTSAGATEALPAEPRPDWGTVGGGRVEARAIDTALAMLADGAAHLFVDWSLKADIGMTCGGRVKLLFEGVGVADWPVVIFGAGHVTQALARLLVTLPCRVTCIDPRGDWLARLPGGVAKIETDDPPAEVARLPGDAFVLCMTRGHRSDLPVLQSIAESGRTFPYLGVIGSAAKGAVLRKELAEAGAGGLGFHCPVGLPIGTNHPAEIAVSIAAQLLQRRDDHG